MWSSFMVWTALVATFALGGVAEAATYVAVIDVLHTRLG